MGKHGPRAILGVMVVAVTLAAQRPARDRAPSLPIRDTLDDDAITVGSFDFAESVLLAEIYGQALEHAGLTVERAFQLGPREFVAPALAVGLIEFVPEYAGSAATFLHRGETVPPGDRRGHLRAARGRAARRPRSRADALAGPERQRLRRRAVHRRGYGTAGAQRHRRRRPAADLRRSTRMPAAGRCAWSGWSRCTASSSAPTRWSRCDAGRR